MLKKWFCSFLGFVGKDTNDNDRPGLRNRDSSEVDKKNKEMLDAAKVRAFIICCECGKRRVVYYKQKLSSEMCRCLDRVEEEHMYSYGSSLLNDGHKFKDSLVVRKGLECSSPTETTYYAVVNYKFDAVCFYCGDIDIVTDENQAVKEL